MKKILVTLFFCVFIVACAGSSETMDVEEQEPTPEPTPIVEEPQVVEEVPVEEPEPTPEHPPMVEPEEANDPAQESEASETTTVVAGDDELNTLRQDFGSLQDTLDTLGAEVELTNDV